MNKNSFKSSFSLFEVIISLLIASIITISSLYYLKDLVSFNKNNLENEIKILDLKSTKIFLQKNSQNLKSNLTFNENKLYYKNSILLKNINAFSSIEKDSFYEININFENKDYNWIILK